MVEAPRSGTDAFGHAHDHQALRLPAAPGSLTEGKHYVALEVHFALAPRGEPAMNWVAILEANTLAVLYLRAFADDLNGQVFLIDPITTNGGPAANATSAALNPVRTSVPLLGLTASSPQKLTGNLVRLADVEAPTTAPPTEPTLSDFNFDARTDNFAAVNAYYHCDRFFRLMQDLGFTTSSFFGAGTTFPSLVDHRGLGGNVINAHCLGTSGGLGILQTTFALADTGDTAHPIGIACDYRVVLHELGGHGVLYPHVHSPNFGFSHSAGDSVAAIICDPETQAPDRFVTFPWVSIGRRHDRTPAAGWGWSGNIALHPFSSVDGGGYNNEQILSTTMFRIYRSMGGDAAQLAKRQFASRFAVYLILRAIASLTPSTNPSNAAGFATALINADLGDWTSAGLSGGAYGKVIRWSFEKQGLYQPAGTPTPNNNVGVPPPVDVYIDDGRHGEYTYQPNHWSCQAIWNRRHADGGTTHEEPIVGVANFAYVKIKNRGTQTASGVVVRAYHAKPGIGLVYPNDWQPMTTAQLAAPNVAPNSAAEITVGPFSWKPSQIGHECMFMVVSANGDASNISNLTAGDSMPEWRLVPNDNNIGQRNVFPVAGGGGLKALLAMLDGQSILIKNPHLVPARMQVNVTLPKFLVGRGWTAVLDNPGAGAFGLKSGEIKPVVLRLKPGKDFVPQDVIKAEADTLIEVVAQADGIVVGGMGYRLDPTLVSRLPTGLTPATRRTRTQEAAPNNAPVRKAATRKTK
jgi:zinc metalloprotease ZmpB